MSHHLLIGVYLLAALAACKRSPSPQAAGSGGGDRGAETMGSPDGGGSAKRSQAFLDFEAVILPLLGEPEGEARSRKTCKQLMTLQIKARALARSRPPGIDEAAWQAAYDDISGSLHGLAPYCNDDPPDDSVELPGLYKSYQRLVALLPGASEAVK